MSIQVRLALAAILIVIGQPTFAQQPEPVRIRGQIEKVDGNALTIKARDGSDVTIRLADNARITAQVKASLSDIKPGSFIGITGMPKPGGSETVALAIHIFMESQRGVVQPRSGPWDLRPNSTMTNANVETTVASVDGQVMTVKYQDSEKKIIVPPDTPIVANAPGNRDEIKPGVQVIVMGAQKQPDGSLTAAAISVGRDGITPPM